MAPLLYTRYRFLVPLSIIILFKVFGGIFLFSYLDIMSSETYWMKVNWGADEQNSIFRSLAEQGFRWPFLFLGWDSAWYFSISAKGYAFSDQSFAFFPGLPLFSWLLNLILQNSAYSLVIFTSIIGVLWIPVYQLIAEDHMDRQTALKATLFYAALPHVFLFTTVAYAEGLFLLFTLISWRLFKRGRLIPSLLAASIATASRSPGLLIVLPMLIKSWSKGRRNRGVTPRRILCFAIPFLSYLVWLIYSGIMAGSWYAPGTRTAWNDLYTLRGFISGIFAGGNTLQLGEPFGLWISWLAPTPGLIFLAVLPFSIYYLFKLDRALAAYSTVYAIIIFHDYIVIAAFAYACSRNKCYSGFLLKIADTGCTTTAHG